MRWLAFHLAPWCFVPCPLGRAHWRWDTTCWCKFPSHGVVFVRSTSENPTFTATWIAAHVEYTDHDVEGRIPTKVGSSWKG